MLEAYATKQWIEALDYARALKDSLEAGGLIPQPMIGSTTGNMTYQLDAGFSRAVCVTACYHTIDRCVMELVVRGAARDS
jgi:hypothetical protein